MPSVFYGDARPNESFSAGMGQQSVRDRLRSIGTDIVERYFSASAGHKGIRAARAQYDASTTGTGEGALVLTADPVLAGKDDGWDLRSRRLKPAR